MSTENDPTRAESSRSERDPRASAPPRRRRWRWYGTLLLGGLALTALGSARQDDRFTAYSLVFVAAEPPRLRDEPRHLIDREEFRLFLQTQEAIIKSNFVVAAAVRHPEIAALPLVRAQPDPVAWLATRVRVVVDGQTMRISLSGSDPVEVTSLVNAVTKSYLTEFVNAEHSQRLARRSRLKDMYAKYMVEVKEKRGSLRKLADSAIAIDREAALDSTAVREQISGCVKEQRDFRLRKAGVKERMARRKARNDAGSDLKPSLEELEEQLAVLERQDKILDELLLGLRRESSKLASAPPVLKQSLELESLQDEVRDAEETARELGRSVGATVIELEAPIRVRLLHLAEVPK